MELENILTPERKKLLKIIAIMLFLVAGLFEGAFFYIKSAIRPEAYEQQVLDAIKKQTGQDIKINGEVKFKIMPSPKLVFSDVASYSTSTVSVPTFSIERVEIYITPMSVFSRQIQLSGIKLVHPVLSIERAEDNTIHWDWINSKLLKAMNGENGKGISLPLYIDYGEIRYKDTLNNKDILIENINASTTTGSQISLNGTLDTAGHGFGFSIDSKQTDLPVEGAAFPLNISVTDAYKNTLVLHSVVDMSGDLPKVIGNFNLNSVDVEKMLQSSYARHVDDGDAEPLTLSFKGKWVLVDDVMQMQEVTLSGMGSEGEGNGSLAWDNWYPTFAVDLDFDHIDFMQWRRLAESHAKVARALAEIDDIQDYDYYKENPLPNNIEFKFNINAQKVMSGKEEWKDIKMNGVLDKGALTLNQCDISLKNDGLLSIFGVVSQGGNGELRFEGNMEAKGKSLRDAITMFYPAGRDLPTIGTGEFSINSNLYANSTQLRIFEANAVVDGTPVSGALTAYLDAQLRIDAKIKLNDVNFDAIRDTLRKESIEDTQAKNAGAPVPARPVAGLDWLRNLSTRLDVKVYVDNFTFMERKGERVSFALYAYAGDLRLTNIQLIYPDGVSEANCTIDARQPLPYISLMVNADQVDTHYFSMLAESKENYPTPIPDMKTRKKFKNREAAKPAPPKEVEKTISEKLDIEKMDTPVPLAWMDNFNGTFDITLRKFIHKNVFMDKVKLQAKLDNKKLYIQKLGFVYSQAQTNILGTIFGGKVPGMEISFTMANADIYEIMKPLININNISGMTSLSGVINTNGWSFHEWLQQMDAKLLVAARGVKVEGINLNGVSNVVDVARSSADVFNNVNNVLTKGSTEFSVDGSMNIQDGELRSPSLTLRSGLVTGTIAGGVKLESLIGQFTVLFRFANLLSDTIPTMIIQLSGNMNKPELKVDTASLEDFVARRNVGK
jgi:hypothetical protein